MFSGAFSPIHWVVVLVIVLIIFGPGKLPSLGKSLGDAIKGFKKSMNEPEEQKSDPQKLEKK